MASLYLQGGRPHIVAYTCGTQCLYFIKIITKKGVGYTFNTKFIKRDDATHVIQRITERNCVDLTHWGRFSAVPADYLTSKEVTQQVFDKLWHNNEGRIHM
jgi:hypothetical protein